MVLIKNPNFLILDEPTNDLDLMTLNTLEEFLDTFPGCLIIVSHDRYFMDRLVEHLFVFEGEGVISDFPGNYTEFRLLEKEQKASETAKPAPKATAVLATPEPAKSTLATPKIKASYKQKQEFKKNQADIATLETEKQGLTDLITAGTEDHSLLMNWSNRMLAIDRSLEELELVWLELSELDGIED
jgi:ATP-binding cassette subfamily F protein uup